MAIGDWSDEDRREINRALAKIDAGIARIGDFASGNYFLERLYEAYNQAYQEVNGHDQDR